MTAPHQNSDAAGTQAIGRWRMPPEWHPHAACWMAWPSHSVVSGARRHEVIHELGAIAHAIAQFEPLRVAVDPAHLDEALRFLPGSATLHVMPVDDHWMRDTGPTFVFDDAMTLHAVRWNFNGWGQKMRPMPDADPRVAERVACALGAGTSPASLVAEGGSLHVDGEGTLIVTETSILNANRNPGLTHREAEAVFRHWLGVTHVVWLPGSWLDTITDGHVDGTACFVRPGVLLATGADGNDEWSREARENLRALRLARDARGRPFDIGILPSPDFDALPANVADDPDFAPVYVNFYLPNGGVVMASFGDAVADARTHDVVKQAFPDRRIVQLPLRGIARRGGGIHCCTQQQPAAALP
ncbi:agmatine deiminase family protein [Pandoraea bronchicola]|uniref:Agmatine deiminase n=1 Tax=Pandoraea bronchicola TaxID=2508287 RepID=A0A5E5BR49_9BURK|nr:agmatine deiminase family protein [Pandoraea bronchicola]VVE86750.1 Agmatine deiminase [Pandoraea bronchicola]